MEPFRENGLSVKITSKESLMDKKLILPAEIRVCATCSYWDGERIIDPELAVVVIEENCLGKCLVENRSRPGLNSEFECRDDCLWEHLAPDAQEQEYEECG
jgi:hypothetical protein